VICEHCEPMPTVDEPMPTVEPINPEDTSQVDSPMHPAGASGLGH
jgi:hypothetical protein